MYKGFIVFFTALNICSCSKQYDIQPNEIPKAHVGQAYNQILNITGGRVIPYSFEVTTNMPEAMNISIQPLNKNEVDAYNNLKIEGIPKYKGNYTIRVYANFYSGGSGELDKTYQFKVE